MKQSPARISHTTRCSYISIYILCAIYTHGSGTRQRQAGRWYGSGTYAGCVTAYRCVDWYGQHAITSKFCMR